MSGISRPLYMFSFIQQLLDINLNSVPPPTKWRPSARRPNSHWRATHMKVI